MNDRLLVTYATKAGSTAQIAEFIGSVLREATFTVDVRPIKNIDTLDGDGYQAVVIGSAVRAGQVLPEVLGFVNQHKYALRKMPTAFFVVCATLHEDTPENRQIVMQYVYPLIDLVKPVSTGLFAGKVDRSTVELPTRLFMRFLRVLPIGGGDWRDWKGIRTWAEATAPLLLRPRAEQQRPVESAVAGGADRV